MNVLLFARSYDKMAGGIEKMSLLIAQGLTEQGHTVTIASLDSEKATSFYAWPNGVSWEKISIGNSQNKASLKERILRVWALRRIAKKTKSDAAIGFQVGSFALLRVATIGMSMKLIAAERNSPTLFEFINRGKSKRFFSNLILFTSTKIAIQFPEYEQYYPWFLRKKLVHTPNPVLQQKVIRDSTSRTSSVVQILFVGRLTFQKNLGVLIGAMGLLDQKVDLTVVGVGPDLLNCQQLSKKLGLKVQFKEPTDNLMDLYLESDYLVSSSRWEGFPNVVAEALSFGLPVIGFKECAGIPQLVTTGVNGVVCVGPMNEGTLAAGIVSALSMSFSPKLVSESVCLYTHNRFVMNWEKTLL
jgi:GalNAc-alpha-(1->4)-GalNAc-alpha-(1->3)-diNAcBac-PP-undecaprenol alpha-1,4-N-acetyl-D-galactosaminyltransferase